MTRAALLLVVPLLALSACERRSTPPNVIPPNLAAKADAQAPAASDAAAARKNP